MEQNKRPRFYADLNPSFPAKYERRYAIFDRNTRRKVARDIAPQFASLKAAELRAKRLNDLEEVAERDFRRGEA